MCFRCHFPILPRTGYVVDFRSSLTQQMFPPDLEVFPITSSTYECGATRTFWPNSYSCRSCGWCSKSENSAFRSFRCMSCFDARAWHSCVLRFRSVWEDDTTKQPSEVRASVYNTTLSVLRGLCSVNEVGGSETKTLVLDFSHTASPCISITVAYMRSSGHISKDWEDPRVLPLLILTRLVGTFGTGFGSAKMGGFPGNSLKSP